MGLLPLFGLPLDCGKIRGLSATIFLPPGPVTTISCLPLACRDAAKLGGTIICLTTGFRFGGGAKGEVASLEEPIFCPAFWDAIIWPGSTSQWKTTDGSNWTWRQENGGTQTSDLTTI
jgi:hypothetical protein